MGERNPARPRHSGYYLLDCQEAPKPRTPRIRAKALSTDNSSEQCSEHRVVARGRRTKTLGESHRVLPPTFDLPRDLPRDLARFASESVRFAASKFSRAQYVPTLRILSILRLS